MPDETFDPFYATVIGQGGGHVNLLIDRQTEQYPPTGAKALVTPAPAATFVSGQPEPIPLHDHDAMLEHLVDEWGARGVAVKLMEGLTPSPPTGTGSLAA